MATRPVLINLGLAAAYIGTSGTLILFNASILKGVYPYPALLTTGHMFFSGGLSMVLVHSEELGLGSTIKNMLPSDFLVLPAMTKQQYMNSIVPIAALQGASLWLSNMAYLYISVSLIQMIKASNTVWTYMWSVPLGLTAWDPKKAANLGVIGAGVAMAALGAVSGGTLGMSIQLVGIIVEAARLALMQLVLQRRGFKLSPITALYYIAPSVVPLLLCTAFVKGEMSALWAAGWHFPLWMMLSNMLLAFSLNFIGLVVIKRMSAIAYVLSGICKDILLVSGGALIWGEVVTGQQMLGYSIALVGLGYYNLAGKLSAPSQAAAPTPGQPSLDTSGKDSGEDDDGDLEAPAGGQDDELSKSTDKLLPKS
eukprot:CAMPEP_0171909874 /NCGR_PEP_ID=MMETSP0993-20121228/9014_1 /TAXON_ID=483369 /ORGANISM="non described non described, Strain CCMP2098" /LENGTH=366 /DNA_ID=CAMNT_0012542923 /DNA_START=28 /DNA_END=1128 /DNA_ORIENTATION=-